MKHFETSEIAKDGLEIYIQGWEPEAIPQAVVCLVHGLGEHSGRYVHVANRMTTAGFVLLAVDLRGHGKSAGARGHVASTDILLDNIDQLLEKAKNLYPGKPYFLYGHSLGGLLTLFYTLKRQPKLAGVVVSSPSLRTALEKQTFKVALSKFLAAILPDLSLPSGLVVTDLSRDPEIVRAYQSDPLVHNRVSFSFAKGSLDAISYTFKHALEFKLPLLLFNGSADNIVYPSGSQEFASLVPGDCTVKIWEGLYHETHNEPEQERVLEYLINWLQSKS